MVAANNALRVMLDRIYPMRDADEAKHTRILARLKDVMRADHKLKNLKVHMFGSVVTSLHV